ncbi:YbjN domain-containing protein [Corynebacterium sp. p3-SID1056]|uniref:YbjN domain-containing protein n=1 Tax=Corynebacterium sp. p3-SID1056 TaxID=2916092 RepID=UPI0021A451C1|nr:YbjN domain-containing protein [Corynebacterium sp. p3-SID1056]MCT2338900.1 YbjN domain-containing protein [Corynebacterium sp. p3-SID1056]
MSTNTTQLVTIDRVAKALEGLDITVQTDASGRAAHANINGYNVLFVLLDSVLIARADAATETPSDTPDPTVYLAANQVNSSFLDARALVVNKAKTLVIRTEAENQVAAGMTDEQLSSALKRSLDGLMRGQDAMHALIEEITSARESAEEQDN